MRKKLFVLVVAVVLVLAFAAPAFASDHLANAAAAPGAAVRGFANPVGGNPSGGTAASHAMPATVPGEGNPNFGQDLGTPAVNLTLVFTRSGGHATPHD